MYSGGCPVQYVRFAGWLVLGIVAAIVVND
jgi:hypothetical protein